MKFLRSNKGTSSIEYAVIASLIAVIFFVAVAFLGNSVKDEFESISSEVSIALHKEDNNSKTIAIQQPEKSKNNKKSKKPKKPKKDKHPRKSWWKWF
jgi:Flp pilus assembly pilin Flp